MIFPFEAFSSRQSLPCISESHQILNWTALIFGVIFFLAFSLLEYKYLYIIFFKICYRSFAIKIYIDMDNCYYGNKTENNENISVTSWKFVFHIKLCRNVSVQFLRCCRSEKTSSVQYLNIVWKMRELLFNDRQNSICSQ